MIYLSSPKTDPAWNLALEQYVFDEMPKNESYFMLWQNDNTIVVGKYQNTAEEVNADYVRDHGIHVVRRLSGGGAVYHDLGNLCYTFITDSSNVGDFNFNYFTKPVVQALARLGVKAEFNSRNDIAIEGKKFSGNAQYSKFDRVMHHGTLMLNSNLDVVQLALNVKPDKYESKGAKSVRSRVCNISDFLPEPITMEEFRTCLLEEIIGQGDVKPYELSEKEIARIDQICAERYATWDWNYGKSPAYNVKKTRKFDSGTVELMETVTEGVLEEIHIYGDFFGNDVDKLEAILTGATIKEEALRELLKDFDVSVCISGVDNETFIGFLVG